MQCSRRRQDKTMTMNIRDKWWLGETFEEADAKLKTK
jgi:hypothetical protein